MLQNAAFAFATDNCNKLAASGGGVIGLLGHLSKLGDQDIALRRLLAPTRSIGDDELEDEIISGSVLLPLPATVGDTGTGGGEL